MNHNPSKVVLDGLLKALIGGLIGYFAFFWLVKQGFPFIALPVGYWEWEVDWGKGNRWSWPLPVEY